MAFDLATIMNMQITQNTRCKIGHLGNLHAEHDECEKPEKSKWPPGGHIEYASEVKILWYTTRLKGIAQRF